MPARTTEVGTKPVQGMPEQAGTVGRGRVSRAGWVEQLPERLLRRVLEAADVRIDGPRPWDPRIVRPRALLRIVAGGNLGAGESYVDGDWECAALDELVSRVMSTRTDESPVLRSLSSLAEAVGRVKNRQTRARARGSVIAHYDRGDSLYEAMLDRSMTYSCGYWREASTLEDAQDAKHDLVCRKLGLEAGMRVLDIGCGWGAFARFAAERHRVQVVGVSVSPSQVDVARRRCAGLPVDIQLRDYREITGRFDRVVSIGMFEHVGPKNYRVFFETVRRTLDPHGLLLLHTIGHLGSGTTSDPWVDRYIFPNAVLPSASQITAAAEDRFVLEDWHNFGTDYERTLLAWHERFEAAWPSLRATHDERFHRMWRYYLLGCAGTFRARRNQLWQIVFSPRGVPGGYRRLGT